MSSFSASGTCDASSPRTSRTITGLALTCRSTRMHRTDGRSSHRRSARSSRFPKLVACITATFGARRSSTPAGLPRHRPAPPLLPYGHPPCPRESSSRLATSTSGGRGLSGASYQLPSSLACRTSRDVPRARRTQFWRRTGSCRLSTLRRSSRSGSTAARSAPSAARSSGSFGSRAVRPVRAERHGSH